MSALNTADDALAAGMTTVAAAAEPASQETIPADEVEAALGAGEADLPDDAHADPREALLGEIRSELVQGGRKVLAILADLGDRRPLLTDEDVSALKKAERDFAKQQSGGAP